MNKKIVIASHNPVAGGAVVLHALCRHLSDLGYNAKIFYFYPYEYKKGKKFLFWRQWAYITCVDLIASTLLKIFGDRILKYKEGWAVFAERRTHNCKRKYLPFVSKDTIVIYPEIVYGNFLHAKNVVRWFLYHNRYANERNEAFGQNDLFICYRKIFNDWDLNPNGYTICTPYYDMELYKRVNFGSRKGTCYILRKGKERADLPEHFDGIIVDDLPEKEKVKVFNECERCISYDTQTAYSSIAALCGCLSIVVPEEGKTKADYLGADDQETYGVAWGTSEEELAFARETAYKIEESYRQSNQMSRKYADDFIKLCEEYFK